MMGDKIVKEPDGSIIVAAAFDMDHDARLGLRAAAGIHAANARLEQIGKVVPVVREFAVGPKHSVSDLVAYLHHIRHHAFAGKGRDRVARVSEDLLHKLLVLEFLPCLGRGLRSRIGPTVGVVQIKKKMKAQRLGSFGQCQRVVQVVG